PRPPAPISRRVEAAHRAARRADAAIVGGAVHRPWFTRIFPMTDDFDSGPAEGPADAPPVPPPKRPRRRKGTAAIDVRALARRQTELAIEALAETLQSPKAPPAAKVSAAIALLDRGWGKVTQTVSFDAGRAVAEFLATLGMGAAAPGDSHLAQPPGEVRDPGPQDDA